MKLGSVGSASGSEDFKTFLEGLWCVCFLPVSDLSGCRCIPRSILAAEGGRSKFRPWLRLLDLPQEVLWSSEPPSSLVLSVESWQPLGVNEEVATSDRDAFRYDS